MKAEESKHFNDAIYEVWRNGYNPDNIDCDQSADDFYNGMTPEYTANREIQEQKKHIEAKRERESNAEEICYNCEVCCNCYGRD